MYTISVITAYLSRLCYIISMVTAYLSYLFYVYGFYGNILRTYLCTLTYSINCACWTHFLAMGRRPSSQYNNYPSFYGSLLNIVCSLMERLVSDWRRRVQCLPQISRKRTCCSRCASGCGSRAECVPALPAFSHAAQADAPWMCYVHSQYISVCQWPQGGWGGGVGGWDGG